MHISRIVEEAFQELEEELEHMLEGLTSEELVWRPDEDANSICFLAWHLGRAEDVWISDYALRRPHVFESGGWAKRWGIDPGDSGFAYDREQLAAFPNPPIDEINRYRAEVRAQSIEYLKTLSANDFDVEPASDHPRRRGYTIGRVWSHLICEIAQHVGQISYLRGLQKGLNQKGSLGDWSWLKTGSDFVP